MNDDIERLWREYKNRIADYIGKTVRDPHITEDLVSTVFMKAWAAMCNGNGYRESETGWLYEIARNVMKDEWRRNSRATMIDFDALADRPSDEPTVYELAETAIVQSQVRTAINRLVDSQKTVMTLRLEGYAYAEIAEIIDNTEMGSKQLAIRAKVRLCEQLQAVA